MVTFMTHRHRMHINACICKGVAPASRIVQQAAVVEMCGNLWCWLDRRLDTSDLPKAFLLREKLFELLPSSTETAESTS